MSGADRLNTSRNVSLSRLPVRLPSIPSKVSRNQGRAYTRLRTAMKKTTKAVPSQKGADTKPIACDVMTKGIL